MLTSISPLGERARVLPVAADEDVRFAAMTLAGFGAAAWDLSGRRFPVRRQVNEDWLTAFRPWVYGVGYGLQLGAAFPTVVNTALVPMFMLAALLADDATSGLVIGAVFGTVRGLSVTVSRRVRTADDLRRLHRRLDGAADRVRLLGALASVLLAGAAALGLVV